MANNKLAIIGGSGLYDVEEFKDRELIDLDTPWGKPSDQILKTNYNSKEVYFLPRHGKGHFISPSNINFRANIDALKQLGVTDIVSISAVGSLKEDLPPGKFIIINQFIDRTFARNKTFFDDEIVAHVSMAHPTSKGLMNACEDAIKKEGIDYKMGGTYVVMEGPQFSTLAESKLYRSWKADVIGMTNMPEAKLAREAEIRYASVSMVTDFDCWHPDHENVDVQQVIKVLLGNAEKAKIMIKNGEGITKLYNRFHNPKEVDSQIIELRMLQQKLDNAVLKSYEWFDLISEQGFNLDSINININESMVLPEKIRNFIEQLKLSGFDMKKFHLSIENLKRSDQTIRFYVEKNKKINLMINQRKKELILKEDFFDNSYEVVFRSLSDLIHLIGKKQNPVRGKKIDNIINKIENKRLFKETLGGCVIKMYNRTVILTKEH